jgi:hypothetical protein
MLKCVACSSKLAQRSMHRMPSSKHLSISLQYWDMLKSVACSWKQEQQSRHSLCTQSCFHEHATHFSMATGTSSLQRVMRCILLALCLALSEELAWGAQT